MIKLPEPFRCFKAWDDYGEDLEITLYTEAQLKQTMRDALEKAAQICMDLAVTDCNDSNLTRHECADTIRALIKEIE